MASRHSQKQSPDPERVLREFPRPFLAVDVALLTLLRDASGTPRLHVLLVEVADPAGRLALPGVMVQVTETLREAARRAMSRKAGLIDVDQRHPHQLQIVDDVLRDPRGRVVTVAHAELVPASRLEVRSPSTHLVPLQSAMGLAYDHDQLVRLARDWAARRYAGSAADPDRLLEQPFSATELRDAHAAVSGEEPHVTTILKKYGDQLERSGRRPSARGRPHELFVVREG